ncbi:glutamate 5-kinase [Nitrosomonas aestuarii]|uniref:Glutamate 5-kinase n=1 Tax=Nitrosomonas aestuarii TaxID=52441 RepID=A0A1I4BS09_9PROT|nr:glutamate 5-kinase [Nitrosomonas aestuarii]SFK71612.1 glutamate 5-kinase [Nitrosomonas aestuarii]
MLKEAHRIVVKVGSTLVTNQGKGLDHAALSDWAGQIAKLKHLGKEVVLVSSGAIAEGMQRLNWNVRPTALYELQAAAAVGQMGLAQAYAASFCDHELNTAQILLTHGDLSNRERYLNARSTLMTLLKLGVIPIINENDTVVTDEIRFGDNDTLAALVTNLIEADALVILTDQAGLYTSDPRKNHDAMFLSEVSAADPALLKMAGGVGSSIGSGGMQSKVVAAKRAARSGAHTIIASGRETEVLVRLARGESIGTRLLATIPVLAARKQWLADYLQVSGTITLDQGAVNALIMDGKSLLPIGVTHVTGNFERGEAVACLTPEGREVARGLINYNAAETRKIMGKASTYIETILGYVDEAELIHRNNLALL